MINKQKMWFITLFSLILILSVYYITMPNEMLTTKSMLKDGDSKNVAVETVSNPLDVLQVELDEERVAKINEYNTILTNAKSTTDEKNSAYDGLKNIDKIKALESKIKENIKKELKLDAFIKIDNNNISVVIRNSDHNYSLANKVMRIVQKEFKNKVYTSVRFQK